MRFCFAIVITFTSLNLLSQVKMTKKEVINDSVFFEYISVNSKREKVFNGPEKPDLQKNKYPSLFKETTLILLDNGSDQLRASIQLSANNKRTLSKYKNNLKINSLEVPEFAGFYHLFNSGAVLTSNYYENWGTTYQFYDNNLNLVGEYIPNGEIGFRDTRIGCNDQYVAVYTKEMDSEKIELALLNHRGQLFAKKEFEWSKSLRPTDIWIEGNQIILKLWGNGQNRVIKVLNLGLEELWNQSPTPPYRVDFNNKILAIINSEGIDTYSLSTGEKQWSYNLTSTSNIKLFPRIRFVSGGKYLAVVHNPSDASDTYKISLLDNNGKLISSETNLLSSNSSLLEIAPTANGFLILSEEIQKIEVQ